MDRIICDSYAKGEKNTWGLDKDNPRNQEFNRRIVAVNDMYGWLYDQGILKEVSFEFKDYSDVIYFAFDAKDLAPYRGAMEAAGLENAALAVQHIFDEAYTPCEYSGAIELSWTMFGYRDFDGTVSRSWECDLVKHLNASSVLDVEEIKRQQGVKAAVHAVFDLSRFEPSDLTKDGKRLTVKPLSEKHWRSVERLDWASGNFVINMLDYDDEVDNFAYVWGLFKGKNIIGYCTIGGADACGGVIESYPGYTYDSLLLSDVFVMPKHRGQGCGAFLVNEAIKLRTQDDKQLVFADVLSPELYSFYEKLGFSMIENGVMVRDERSIEAKRFEADFERAFEHYSKIDCNMLEHHDYLLSHGDKLIYCYDHDVLLDLMDVDCWVRYEVLLGETLSYEDYSTLNEFVGDEDPHDISEDDIEKISSLRNALEESRREDAERANALEDLIESAKVDEGETGPVSLEKKAQRDFGELPW